MDALAFWRVEGAQLAEKVDFRLLIDADCIYTHSATCTADHVNQALLNLKPGLSGLFLEISPRKFLASFLMR